MVGERAVERHKAAPRLLEVPERLQRQGGSMSRDAVRVLWRNQGGVERAYVDLRPWGGKRTALKVPGEKRALTRKDKELAEGLAAQFVATVAKNNAEHRERAVVGLPQRTGLADDVA